jgi:hypothetical protein
MTQFFLSIPGMAAQDGLQGSEKNRQITARFALSWWSHGPSGYRPAVGVYIENTSGRDLSNVLVRFQARFFDLRTGSVQIARDEMIGDFPRDARHILKLKSAKPYELPIENEHWPSIECKVMCRVGDVGDEGTQELVVTKIQKVAMTDEEATERLGRFQGGKLVSYTEKPKPKEVRPLAATSAGSLSASLKADPKSELTRLLSSSRLPGLGDDFYFFEQIYKRPLQYETTDNGWTWARYAASGDSAQMIVGSKGQGKADIILAVISASSVSKESQLVSLAQLLLGKGKADRIRGPENSVRYLSTGRVQVGRLASDRCKGAILHPRGNSPYESKYVLELTRLPDDLDAVLNDQFKRVTMLSVYTPFAGIDTSN